MECKIKSNHIFIQSKSVGGNVTDCQPNQFIQALNEIDCHLSILIRSAKKAGITSPESAIFERGAAFLSGIDPMPKQPSNHDYIEMITKYGLIYCEGYVLRSPGTVPTFHRWLIHPKTRSVLADGRAMAYRGVQFIRPFSILALNDAGNMSLIDFDQRHNGAEWIKSNFEGLIYRN